MEELKNYLKMPVTWLTNLGLSEDRARLAYALAVGFLVGYILG